MKFGVPLWNQILSHWITPESKKTHLHFCKRYLEVHNKSSNVACRSELGRFPLIIDINNKILNYLNYLQEKDENSIVKQSLKISVDLYHSGQNSFYSSLKKMTDYYDFPGFNCNLLNKCKIKQYVDLMQKKYISYWNHTLQHSQKLNFYCKIKTNYSPSAYLDLTRKNPSRKTLVKLRISSHKLRIETGRYDNMPRDDGLCSFSNCNRIEDETIFIRLSKFFCDKRDVFL